MKSSPSLRQEGTRFSSSPGFSIVEVLIVLAIVGVVTTVVVVSSGKIFRSQEALSALNSVQQSVWQGATAAAARGVETELVRQGERLVVREVLSERVLRKFDLTDHFTSNMPEGQVLLFTPPGKIALDSLDALPDPLTVSFEDRSYELVVSLIGEVKVERTQ